MDPIETSHDDKVPAFQENSFISLLHIQDRLSSHRRNFCIMSYVFLPLTTKNLISFYTNFRVFFFVQFFKKMDMQMD